MAEVLPREDAAIRAMTLAIRTRGSDGVSAIPRH